MKIVDKKEFVKLKIGTLFCRYEPCTMGAVCIFMGNCNSDDFYFKPLVEIDESQNPFDNYPELLLDAEKHNKNLKIDTTLDAMRDGVFDNDEKYMVFDFKDTVDLRKILDTVIELIITTK